MDGAADSPAGLLEKQQSPVDTLTGMMPESDWLEAEDVRSAVETLLSEAIDEAPVRIERGYGNINWWVRAGDRQLIVKIDRGVQPVEKWIASARAHRLAVASGASVPAEVLFDSACEPFGGRMVRIYEYLPSRHPVEVLTERSITDRFFTELGRSVARLHTVAFDGFSSRIGGLATFPTWADYLDYRLPQIVGRVRAARSFSESETTSMISRVAEMARKVSPVVKPRLTHRDLYLDNILATDDGGVAAIIDFDGAEAWDPIADLARPRWQIFGKYPGAERAFRASYLREAGDVPMLEERIWIAEMIELINVAANADREGSIGYGASARRRLSEVRDNF